MKSPKKLVNVEYYNTKTSRLLGYLTVLWQEEPNKYVATFYSPAGKPIATRINNCAAIFLKVIGRIQALPREEDSFISRVKLEMAAS